MRRSRKRRSRRKKKTSCNPQEPESASIYFDHDEGQVIVSFPERSKNENMTVGEIQRLEKPSFVIIDLTEGSDYDNFNQFIQAIQCTDYYYVNDTSWLEIYHPYVSPEYQENSVKDVIDIMLHKK